MEELPETTGLDDLPALAMEKVVEFLDYESRRTCRLVSKNLKWHVDDIGLSVRIDTRELGLSGFCQSVTITEAHVLYLKELDLKKQQLKAWKTAILSGPVDNTWLNNGLLQHCSNLRVLILNGDCLVSQDLTGPVESQPIFHHLTQTHFSLNSTAFSQAVQKVCGLLHLPVATNQTYKKMYARVQNNMAYLLRAIRSRVLKTFYAFVNVNLLQRGQTQKQKVRWEHEPLFQFFHNHRHTLEEIIVPTLLSGEPLLERKAYDIPIHLKLFSWNPGPDRKFETYWLSMLLAQNALGKLCMNMVNVPANQFLQLLSSVSSNNAHSLTQIQLSLNNVDVSVDMKTFQCCEALESFYLEAGSKIFLRNLNQLPRARLSALTLRGFVVDIESDFDAVQFMQGFSPEFLTLGRISCQGFFNDPKYMLKFIKLVLRSRVLNEFSIMMNLDNPPPACWNSLSRADSNELGLQTWIANLQAQEAANHRYTHFAITDIRALHTGSPCREKLMPASGSDSDLKYVEANKAVHLNYLELISRFEMAQAREQPLNIPRNAESYSLWTNQATKAYKVVVNTKPYTERVNNIEEQVRVIINFVTEGANGDS